MAGRSIHMRFKSITGDAMGMNMVSKGVEKAVVVMQQIFPDLQVMRCNFPFIMIFILVFVYLF